MKVVVLYVEGCPNRELAESRVELAAQRVGLPVDVRSQMVGSVAEAHLLGFRGSPTLLIDGADVFGGNSGQDGLACRLYRTADGVEGSPSLDDLIRAISLPREAADDV